MKKGNDSKAKNSTNGSDFNFEAQLWEAADKLRGRLDASDYNNVALGFIFLKYISDASVVRIYSSNGGEAPGRRNKKAEMMESLSIAALRDALLPKLLSGEMRRATSGSKG